MKKEFIEKIIRESIVDTAKYRYIVAECHDANNQWAEIRRMPLEKLGTTAAIDGWETVYVIK